MAPPRFPIFAWFLVTGERPAFFIAVQAVVALLIIVKHHQNIRRLFAGTEHRFGAKDRMSRIAVLGSGAWGTAIALSLDRRGGHQVTLWAHSPEAAEEIRAAGENKQFLPGFPLPSSLIVTGDCAAVHEADIVVSVVPSEFLRATMAAHAPFFACAPDHRQRHQGRRGPHASCA